ncbi:hypothetical protein ABPG74_001322 [Tetrahymena malaccensis]
MNKFKACILKYYQQQICISFHKFNRRLFFSQFLQLVRFAWLIQLAYTNKVADQLINIDPNFSNINYIDGLRYMNEQSESICIYFLICVNCLLFIQFALDIIFYKTPNLKYRTYNHYNQILFSFLMQSYNYLFLIPSIYLYISQIKQKILYLIPLLMSIIIAVTNIIHDQRYEFSMNDLLGWRSHFQYGLLQCFLEILSCIYLGFFKNAVGQSIITAILGLLCLLIIMKAKPFQHRLIRKFSYFYSSYYTLFTIILMFTLIKNDRFAFSLITLLILPVSFKLSNLLDQYQTSFTQIFEFIQDSDVKKYDFELRSLIQNIKLEYEDYRLNSFSLFLDQLSIRHKLKCSKKECFCQQTDQSKKDYQITVISGQQRNFFLGDFIINCYQDYLKQIDVKKQQLDTCSCLSYLNYLLFSNRSKVLAFTELIRYRNHPELSLREQSLMSELFKTANKQMLSKENDNSFMGAIKYDELIEQAEKQFQETIKMKEKFLILLFNDFIELKELRQEAIKLKQSRDQLQKQLVDLSKIHYSNQSLQFLLDNYISLLAFGQTKKILFKKKNQSIFAVKNKKQLSIDQNLFDKDCCILFITLVNRIGTIKKFQNKITQVFGYSQKDLQDKNISILIPSPAQKHHDSLLKIYIEGINETKKEEDYMDQIEQDIALQLVEYQKKGGSLNTQIMKEIISKRESSSRFFPMLLALNVKGWAVPVSLTIKFDCINQDDCGAIGLIQKLHSDYYYLQVDSDNFQIQAVSEQLYQKAFADIFIQNDIKRIYFNRFAPFLKHHAQISKKKSQKPLALAEFLKQSNNVVSSEQKINFNTNTTENSDVQKTYIFIPKENIAEKNTVYFYDKPIINDQQQKNQIENYSLELYDVYVTKFKIYHKENSFFSYSILEFHSFRKVTEYKELRDTMVKLQKRFNDILQINYDITNNLKYIDQIENIQLISQANVNSFLDIIEEQIRQKSDDQLLQQSLLLPISSERQEENIEATDRNLHQYDQRTNLIHLDPKTNMVSHQNQQEDNEHTQVKQIVSQLEQNDQHDLFKMDSTLVNDETNHKIVKQNQKQQVKQLNQQLLNPPNKQFTSNKKQQLQKLQQEQKNTHRQINQQNDLKSLELSYNILSPNDQSIISYSQDHSRVFINQNQFQNSITDRVEVDDLVQNQNNFSITYTRYNNEKEDQHKKGKQPINNQFLGDQNMRENDELVSQLSHKNQNSGFNKPFFKENFDDLDRTGLFPIQNNQYASLSILSPNQIYSKLSLNTTTSRNMLSSKPQLNNIILQRLNQEILKETDRNRLIKMETLRSSLKNHNLEDLELWKLSSIRKEVQIQTPQPDYGIDRKSKLETSYIIKAEIESSADCTDTIDREERIKRELQERSRMVAVSSRQSSQSNNTDMKRNLKKSLNSQKKNFLMIVLTIFGFLALASILTLTMFQYFKINFSFSTVQRDFYFIPWPIDLRSDYTIPLLYQGIQKLIKTGQFNSIKDPSLQNIILQRMQTSLKHLFSIFNYYQTADINDRAYFRYINDNPIDLTLGIDDAVIPDERQKTYFAQDKIVTEVNLDYFIQVLSAYQYKVVINDGILNYYEKIQIDNYSTLEDQALLVSQVAMDCAKSSNDDAVQQTLVLLILVIIVSFVLITAIFPLYYYVQANNQQCLKLFATISSEQLTSMLKPIQFTLAMSKSIKITTMNFNTNFQNKYKKRKNISSTSLLPKFKLLLLVCGVFAFLILIIQPIVNYVLLLQFQKEVDLNIHLLSSLYSIRSLLISTSALNYQYMSYRTDDKTFLYNPQFYADQIPKINQRFQTGISQMYQIIQQDQGSSRHNQHLYDNFLYQLLTKNVCDSVLEYPQFVSSENQIDDGLCRQVRSGLLTKGFELSVKDYYQHIQSLEVLYQLKTLQQFQAEIQIWTEQTKIKEFDQYFNLLSKSVLIMKDFMISMMNEYLDYMKFIQTVLLIFQIFALIFLFIFGWINFYLSIQSDMLLTKQLFSVLSIETVLENPYILSFLNK